MSSDRDRAPIWALPEPGARRSRLSREQIAAAALQIADAEGFSAVSMRRVAAELGAGTMSLYHYVRDKQDLIALMDDALMGEVHVPDEELSSDWREAVMAIASRTRAVFVRHPWALAALQGEAGGRSAVGPNTLRHAEQSLVALSDAPLDVKAKVDLIAIVDDYVAGHALRAAEITQRGGPAGSPDSEAARFVDDKVRAGRYPLLAALAVDPAVQEAGDPAHLEERFERGLRVLLNGASTSLSSK
jgi:AcrR family transcriptional regulator